MTQPDAPLPAIFVALEDVDLASLRVIIGNWQYVFDVGQVPVGISELCKYIERRTRGGVPPKGISGGLE